MLLRGSEWRRWDLHVHTPQTALNDQYGDWEEYLLAIEATQDVKVIGVTDYMTITNYSRLKAEKQQGRITNIDLLIPNIEFRIAPPSDRATAVNIHLLICPDDANHENEILNALGRLKWRYDARNYSCLPDQLMALGRAFDPAVPNDRAALAAGVTQFKVDFTKFGEWFEDEPWLKRNSLIAVAAGEDGLSGFQRDGAWGGYREEITRFSQVIFSGRPGEREFWIGRRSPEDRDTVMRLGGFKPCVHGSDAHSIAKLFRPDQDRFCWIKADPTFEGLKQILYEPEDRVHIGPTPPIYHDEARVISAIGLSHSNGWFDDVEIPLNAGLVSIIGQKGSGKSALAEIIAYTAGSWITEEPGSFLRRAGNHIDDLTVELLWADGSVSSARLGDQQPDGAEVRYLSQKFVERLCADDHIGAELVHEIEAVKREQQTLEELYAPVTARLQSESASAQEQDLEFSIRWEADLPKWLERGSVLFDQRKTIPYGTFQELGNAARKILAPAWTSGDPAKMRPAVLEFLAEFRKPELPASSYLRSGVTVQDVLERLYEVEHVRLSYGLKYNGVELEKLSPGTKGIVLLILYLGMDIADTRPLIVDQPDENLDNESIYELLTAYFKSAKTRRQILLITHNPNLVVNADSEQVIVASASRRDTGFPHITYRSGALENNVHESLGIRQQVCRILEGGSDAFRKRERRYALNARPHL